MTQKHYNQPIESDEQAFYELIRHCVGYHFSKSQDDSESGAILEIAFRPPLIAYLQKKLIERDWDSTIDMGRLSGHQHPHSSGNKTTAPEQSVEEQLPLPLTEESSKVTVEPEKPNVEPTTLYRHVVIKAMREFKAVYGKQTLDQLLSMHGLKGMGALPKQNENGIYDRLTWAMSKFDDEEPIAEEPIAEEPVAEEPVVEEPTAEEPTAEEPVAEEPAVEEPVATSNVSPDQVRAVIREYNVLQKNNPDIPRTRELLAKVLSEDEISDTKGKNSLMNHIVENLTHRHDTLHECFSNALNDVDDSDDTEDNDNAADTASTSSTASTNDESPENDVMYNIELAKSAIRDYGEKHGMTEQNVCQLLQSKGIDVLNINAIRPKQVVDIQALLI